jgi:hypothetical protein
MSEPKTGEKRLSEFFSGRYQPWGVVVLTRYLSDNHWYFYIEGDPKKEELKARTAWSEMPLVPEVGGMCVVCHRVPVDVDDGYDTCDACSKYV